MNMANTGINETTDAAMMRRIIRLDCIAGIQIGDDDLQCLLFRTVQVKQWCQIIIPCTHEPQNELGCDSRLDGRHNQFGKNLEIACAIDFGCFDDRIRDVG